MTAIVAMSLMAGTTPRSGAERRPNTVQPISVVAVHVALPDGERRGTATLIAYGDDHGAVGSRLYFLTSSRLLRRDDSGRPPLAVRLRAPAAAAIEIRNEDVLCPAGLVEIAILRTASPAFGAVDPASLSYNPPIVGEPFGIIGVGDDGSAVTLAERVRFQSTLLIVGDRDASALAGCVGAPALSATGLFGVVRECEENRPAVVSLLPLARSVLDRYLRGATT